LNPVFADCFIVSQEKKFIIRNKILKLLRNQKEEDRLRKGLKIRKKLFASKEFQNSKTILFYASFDGEVDTLGMIKQALRLGKRIALPVILRKKRAIVPALIKNLRKDLIQGPYGIQQPKTDRSKIVPLSQIDLVILPGLVFDKRNHRLGRGAGFYDRFLADLPENTPTIGLAYDFQVIDRLPSQSHDIPVLNVITN